MTTLSEVRPRLKKTLHELRTTGFRKLLPRHIHLRCYVCGRKMSNSHQFDAEDPPGAFLLETPCPECADKDSPSTFFDSSGKELEPI